MKDLKEVVEKVKEVDDGVNNLIVPLLKDTIADKDKTNNRSFILNIILSISLLITAIFSQLLVAYQNQKYADFLSQFEFESEVIQDLDTGDYGDIYNPTLNNTK